MSWPALSSSRSRPPRRSTASSTSRSAVGLDADVGRQNERLGAALAAERGDLFELRGVARGEGEPGPPAPPAGELEGHLASDADRSAGEQHGLMRWERHRRNLALDEAFSGIYPLIRIYECNLDEEPTLPLPRPPAGAVLLARRPGAPAHAPPPGAAGARGLGARRRPADAAVERQPAPEAARGRGLGGRAAPRVPRTSTAWPMASCPRARASSGSSPPARPASGRRWRTTGCAWRAVWRTPAGEGRDFFAGVAGEWERLRTELYGERFTGLAFQALLAPDWVVADLACGSGAAALALAPWVGARHRRRPLARDARRRRGGAPTGWTTSASKRATSSACRSPTAPATPRSCCSRSPRSTSRRSRSPRWRASSSRAGARWSSTCCATTARSSAARWARSAPASIPKISPCLLAASGFDAVRCSPLPPEPEARGPALLLASGTRVSPGIPPQRRKKGSAS